MKTILSNYELATYKLLAKGLVDLGYSVDAHYESGTLIVTYISPAGKTWKTAAARLRYPFIRESTYALFANKQQSYAFVASMGVPIPYTHIVAPTESLSKGTFDEILAERAPLIVKPNDSLQSRGLSLNVNDDETLRSAIDAAQRINNTEVLIQQQVSGDEVRFFVIKGKVSAALVRQTPRVIGDGFTSVQGLIAIENEARRSLQFQFIQYPQLTSDIIDPELLKSQYVPSSGEVIELSRSTMISGGCSVYQILEHIHPSYIKEIEKLVENIDANFLVADFILEDHRAPQSSNNHWFLEFNGSPSVKLCYGCRDGKMYDVIPEIVSLIDETLSV